MYDRGSQGLNRYSYALNNPLRYLDPTGHFATNGPTEDETNPTCYGCETGSQRQFAMGEASVHTNRGFNLPWSQFQSHGGYLPYAVPIDSPYPYRELADLSDLLADGKDTVERGAAVGFIIHGSVKVIGGLVVGTGGGSGGTLLTASGVGSGAGVLVIVGSGTVAKGLIIEGVVEIAAGAATLWACAVGDGGSSPPNESNLPKSQQKAIRSYRKRIVEHQKKLAEYKSNPEAYDNRGVLENAPNETIRQQIIERRIRHLEKEIRTFQENIDKIINSSSGG